ncbi:MAG: hypothetical protein DRI86_01880 [Bacteroidetes bacterium]|nr:MAG: hypothetical protein DRI86_01880 [Bacteroidota bacterium]
MKKTLQVLLIIIATLFSPQVKASHFAGADLTYTCLGGATYLITLSFYRDCSGVQAPTSVDIDFECTTDATSHFSKNLPLLAGSGQEITPGCSAAPTYCSTGSAYGIQEYVYQATVTLTPCNYWELNWADGNRNLISTVLNNDFNSWFMPAKLNNLTAYGNSSPTFSNKPIAIVCNNQSFCFNHGAIDPDGDSLVYSFYAPYTNGFNSSVNYVGSYSASNFLSSSTPITLDPVTGDLCFTPSAILTTVTGIKVEEWRRINGVATLIGTVYRDIQLMVTTCSNNIPILSGMDTLLTSTYNPADTIYYLEECLGPDPITFHVNGFDIDTFNSSVVGNPEKFHIEWNHGISGASFIPHYNGTDSAYAEFSWLPTIADVTTIPKCFTASIHDEACPYYGSQTFSYCIVVRGMAVSLGTDTLLCEGENIIVNGDADTTTVNYLWSMDGVSMGIPTSQDSVSINSSSLGVGQHILSIETNDGSTTMVCPGRDKKVIDVVYQPHINGTLLDSAFCEPGSVTYDAGQGQVFNWTNIYAGGAPVGAGQTFTTNMSGKYRLMVDGGQNTRCRDIDTFTVVPIRPPELNDDTCLWIDGAPYELDAGFVDPGNIYKWSTGEDIQKILVSESGEYSISISNATISPSVKCSATQIVNIMNHDNFIMSIPYMASEESPMPGEDWTVGNQDVCTYQRVRMRGPVPPNGHSYSYLWTKDGVVASITNFYFFKEENEGTFTMHLSAGGCEDEIDITSTNCDVEVPNIITPNGDGSNDVFKIILKGTTKDFYESFPNSKLIIFNRWGKKIYESNNYQNDWSADNLTDGVYYWNLYLADGQETEMNGSVTIMRK